MKALVYTGPNSLVYRDEPDPQAGVDVLVRVEAVGICGSDLHAYHGQDSRRPAPLILGHEAAGHVLTGPRAGRRVVVNPLVFDPACPFAIEGRPHLSPTRQILSMPLRPGAFAEIVRVPEANLVDIPDRLDVAKAALAEPLAVAYHAVNRGARLLERPVAGARTLVLGGGAIGLAAALVLNLLGARAIHVAEPNPMRRDRVASAGPFLCYGGDGEGPAPADASVDLVIDAVGAAPTREAATRRVRPGGVIVHVGLLPGSEGFDVRRITLQEIIVTGTYCYTPADFRETVAAMVDGRLGPLDWIEERPLAEGASAFADIDAGRVAAPKIVLRP